jgi:hypothetical protein
LRRYWGHSGHDRNCCWLGSVKNDPEQTFASPGLRL